MPFAPNVTKARTATGAAARMARAQLLAKSNSTREEEAAFIFHKFNESKSGQMDEDELLRCFGELGFSNGRQNKSDEDMRKWVRQELKKGDKAGNGKLSYSDFIEYYNKFVVGRRRMFEETYEMGSQIGHGAFGNVFRAKRIGGLATQGSVTVGTQVAVKQVKKEQGNYMDLLRNEIIIWRQLDHPNLIKLHDVFESDDQLLLVTDLMRGGDLFQQLARASTFSEAEAAKLARQIISAVAYLHENGIVHCDLKPSNILVLEKHDEASRLSKEKVGESKEANSAGMNIKIADFGLSQSLGVRGGPGEKLTDVCGTPDYFAPELADIALNRSATEASREADSELEDDGKGYGPPLDCWAVGCIVYELIAGHPPYQAQDENVLFYKIMENQMEFPKEAFGEISPDAIQLIKELTVTDPDERLSCEVALSHAWLAEDNAALAATPLPDSTAKRRRQSLALREDAKDAMLAAAAAAAATAGTEELTAAAATPAQGQGE